MNWLALNRRSVSTSKILITPDVETVQHTLLTRGTIVFDIDFLLAQKAPCRLVHFSSDHLWQRRFTLYLNADFSLSVEMRQGSSRSYVRISDTNFREAAKIRLSYVWDAPAKFGLLSIENTESGEIHQTNIPLPVPLPLADAKAIVLGGENVRFDDRMVSSALGDGGMPVGPVASIAAGATIDTPEGPRPIERLKMGDIVLTKDNGPQPVRWVLKNDLPAIGDTAPMRLRAPFFGLVNDVIVAGHQRVLISGIETEYNLGQDAALIDAQSLIGHPAAAPISGALFTTYYQVLLDIHDCINVSGVWADSLYVGRLASTPKILAATGLSEIPMSILPTHTARAHPLLRGYERQALLDTLTA
ncbi:MAG: Hint domain-containing protein [Paracoccaceae bacterium]